MEEYTRTYYASLQAALLSYDAKLWQIPALFTAVIGLTINAFNFTHPFLVQNFFVTLITSVGFFILILLHNKALIFHISIQKRIDELDVALGSNLKEAVSPMSLTSMTNSKLLARISEMDSRKEAHFNPIQVGLALFRVSKIIQFTMFGSFFLTLAFCAVSFVALANLHFRA